MNRNNITFSLTIGFSPKVKTIKRSVYTILDCIGDLGGLNDGLSFIVACFVAIYNFIWFEIALVSSLAKF